MIKILIIYIVLSYIFSYFITKLMISYETERSFRALYRFMWVLSPIPIIWFFQIIFAIVILADIGVWRKIFYPVHYVLETIFPPRETL